MKQILCRRRIFHSDHHVPAFFAKPEAFKCDLQSELCFGLGDSAVSPEPPLLARSRHAIPDSCAEDTPSLGTLAQVAGELVVPMRAGDGQDLALPGPPPVRLSSRSLEERLAEVTKCFIHFQGKLRAVGGLGFGVVGVRVSHRASCGAGHKFTNS